MPPVTKSASNPARAAPSDVRPHAVADREHATLLDRRASNLFSERQRPIVDRRVRLAGVDDRTAELLVSTRERSRAIDESVAAVDHDVRIGADHRHAADRHRPQFRFVIIERFGLVISEAGAERILGVFEGHESRPRASRLGYGVEKAQVALRPDVEDLVAGLLFHQSNRHVARRDDGVERVGRNPELQHLAFDRRRGPRRVADENDGAAPPSERHKRLRGLRERGHAIVQYAPDVAKNRVITVRDLAQTANLPDDLRLFLPHRRARLGDDLHPCQGMDRRRGRSASGRPA